MIDKPGSINFWFDPKKNPNAFTSNVNCKWIDFEVNGEK
jgi:hypothetical protein